MAIASTSRSAARRRIDSASRPCWSMRRRAAVRMRSTVSAGWPARRGILLILQCRITHMELPLAGHVALVAGGTRGAGRGIAVQLGAAGATVYVTGRSTRAGRSPMDRPETIDDTADLVDAAGGH